MLDVEQALAEAEADAGLVPPAAAAAIADACRPELYDIAELCEQGRASGNPVEPLVRALRGHAGEDAQYVHLGATSPGRARQRLDARRAQRPPADRRGAGGAASAVRTAGRAAPLDAARRPDAAPAGGGDDVRREGVRLARRRRRGAGEARRRTTAGPARRRRGNARAARRAGDARAASLRAPAPARGAGRAVARASVARRRVGGCARRGRRSCREDRPRRRPARADRGRRGLRSYPAACPRRCRTSGTPCGPCARARAARLAHANAGVLTGGEHEHERAAGHWHAEWSALSELLALREARRAPRASASKGSRWTRHACART